MDQAIDGGRSSIGSLNMRSHSLKTRLLVISMERLSMEAEFPIFLYPRATKRSA